MPDTFLLAFSLFGTFSREIAHAADEVVSNSSISGKREDLLQFDTKVYEEQKETEAIFGSLKQKKRYEDAEEDYYDEDEEYDLGDIKIGEEYVIKKPNIRYYDVNVYNLNVNRFMPKDVYIMTSFSEGTSTGERYFVTKEIIF